MLGPSRAIHVLVLLFMGPSMVQDQLPDIRVTPVDDRLTKLWVNGYVNVLVVRCGERFVLIDAGFEATADQLASKLHDIGVESVDYLINTHSDGDHTGGNRVIGREGEIIAHARCKDALAATEGFPNAGLPTTTFTDSMRVRCGSGELSLIAMPGAHTDNDIVVHLPEMNALYLGDLIVPETFPVVWSDRYADVSVERLPVVLGEIMDRYPENTRFLSSHGRDYTKEELRTYREMVLATMNVIRKAMNDGKTVENMRSEDALGDWASWNSRLFPGLDTDYWIESVFRSLTR